jgi:excisionase family DNA binding protein
MGGYTARPGTVALPAAGRSASGPAPSPRRLFSVDEAAEHLSVSVRFIRRLVAEWRIRHMKVGRYVRFDRTDLDAFVAAGVREALRP